MSLRDPERSAMKDEVLRWINEQRTAHGLPQRRRLLKGRRFDPASCPVARSLGMGQLDPFCWWDDEGVCRGVPAHVKRFIGWFDNGQFPALELAAP